jgi:hypothetical protein
MAYRGTLQIVIPGNGQQGVAPGPLDVVGYWTAPGQPEPDPPESITIQHGPTIVAAEITRTSPNSATTWLGTFQSPQGSITVSPGTNVISATGTDDVGSRTVEVTFTVGGNPPLQSQFTGTATLTTTYSRAPGPFAEQVSIGLLFSGDRKTVTVDSFPPITTLPFSVGILGSDTVTITLTGGGTGAFDSATGRMDIVVTLHFHHSNSLLGDSDLTMMLSTDQGSTLNKGAITIGGSGMFMGGVLGGSTGTLVIAGTISPSP